MTNLSPLTTGSKLENRYEIVRELGRGGFGRTYLALDINRYKEPCVLKEFAPQLQSTNELRKAEELFEREASVLYKLQHPQIPRFRELLRLSHGNVQSVFLVQDYVEGLTYAQLLKSYQQQGNLFNEGDVIHLLLQILPVLEYIHSQGVVHRDISPENMIQRSSDRLPVLIDFGGVKQAATTAVSKATGQPLVTLLGKEGYAPQEQIRQGKAFPCSDLYALAVTVLVLLTGKEPKALYDGSKGTWRWRQLVSVSPTLGKMFDKMLAYRPGDRYQSVQEVLQVLSTINPIPSPSLNLNPPPTTIPIPSPNPDISQMQTVNFVGSHPDPNLSRVASNPSNTIVASPGKKFFGAKLLAGAFKIAMLAVIGIGGWNFVKSGFSQWLSSKSFSLPTVTSITQSELVRQTKIMKRRKALGISEATFYSKVDRLFYAQYPELRGRSLTNKPEDEKYRLQWCDIAEEFLDKVENGDRSDLVSPNRL